MWLSPISYNVPGLDVGKLVGINGQAYLPINEITMSHRVR
jgi:hypothetical protein